MKYANIRRLGYKDGINRIGIGDYIQLLAIDNIYNEMNILSKITYLDLWDIRNYCGEKVVLPVNQLLVENHGLTKKEIFVFQKTLFPFL